MLSLFVLALLALLAPAARADHKEPDFPGFNCPALPSSPTEPVNVTKLRPNDIAVTMALGDSISAGFGMKAGSIDWFTLEEWRGSVFSIGADKGELTLPNFLKQVNNGTAPQGGSTGKTFITDGDVFSNHSVTPNDPKKCHMNAAQSNAQAEHMLAQTDYLVTQLRASPALIEKWKVLTVLIGANNVCIACDSSSITSHPNEFERSVRATFDKIMAAPELKKTFVNLVLMVNVSATWEQRTGHCVEVQHLIDECGCLNSESGRVQMSDLLVEYNKRLVTIASDYSRAGVQRGDFAVVAQPFFSGADIPPGYLSNFDCFHPDAAADANMAIGLWNNMLSPASQKVSNVTFPAKAVCPGPNDLLQVF